MREGNYLRVEIANNRKMKNQFEKEITELRAKDIANTLELERLKAIAGEIEKADQEVQTEQIVIASERSTIQGGDHKHHNSQGSSCQTNENH